MVAAVPAAPMVGEKDVMVGALLAITTNGVPLVTEPFGVVTLIEPVVAPAGTAVTILSLVEELTVAATPLNWTVFWLGVALKPMPWITTEVPLEPLLGVKSAMETDPASFREMEITFPTAS
jgi:hypothetical protein